MKVEEMLMEIRSIKERLIEIDPHSIEFAELCVAVIELQNSIIHQFQSEAA